MSLCRLLERSRRELGEDCRHEVRKVVLQGLRSQADYVLTLTVGLFASVEVEIGLVH